MADRTPLAIAADGFSFSRMDYAFVDFGLEFRKRQNLSYGKAALLER